MESLSSALAGFQMSMLPTVEAYWIENPQFAPPPERLKQFRESLPPEQPPQEGDRSQPKKPKSKRVQVGWIEHRWGNKSREKQSLSIYYCYMASEWELYGEGSKTRCKRQRIYLQVHQCHEITSMVHQKRPYTEILQRIGETKRISDKPHHTKEEEWG